ncbi:hypothetical protein CERSUDRAFT_100878 [Gelatoporia subvermispora B]|uniref:Ribonucleases P/MRP subunit Pop8-like domain-containing protein n=1 Tax=Ceriporiopsis subvermispora (strain B) TaxID=914234 RepID=M2QWM4_CERS8|nr:hypothetical protein CERSUDRAFT_100878 [Gelatoporia subvermispora B]
MEPANHYIRFSVSPPNTDALTLRKALQDALSQTFGLVAANTYIDILWVAEDGTEVVLRVARSNAQRVLSAVAASAAYPRLSLVKSSAFLPSLLSVEPLS